MNEYGHKEFTLVAEFECGCCKRRFPMYYINKGDSYWGNRGRYNFRGARANFNRHTKACEKAHNKQLQPTVKSHGG